MANFLSLETLYKVIKYILIVSNVLIIIGALFIAVVGKDFGEPEFKNHHGALIFSCIVVIIFCSVGIIGVWKENFVVTIIYGVLMTIALILEIAELSSDDIVSFVISIIIVICAFTYAGLIKRTQQLEAMRRSFSHEATKI